MVLDTLIMLVGMAVYCLMAYETFICKTVKFPLLCLYYVLFYVILLTEAVICGSFLADYIIFPF